VSPQYGGEMVIRSTTNPSNLEPNSQRSHYTDIFRVDGKAVCRGLDIGSCHLRFQRRAAQAIFKGLAGGKLGIPAPDTLVVHIRKDINWQDIPPVNGREFTAYDVEYHYHRLYGLGSGFTKPAPYHGNVSAYKDLISVTATINTRLSLSGRRPIRSLSPRPW